MRNQHGAYRRQEPQRRGAVLVWFAILIFALLPIVALVVHTGMITLTRRQMQTAVNSAAVEGLRFRDAVPELWRTDTRTDLVECCDPPPEDENSSEYATWLDCARRWSAGRQVSMVFDDDLNPDNDDVLQLGAGPAIAFDDEVTDISLPGTDFKASRTIRSANIGVYDPQLEFNVSDERHGDMVSGQYVSEGCHQENGEYFRGDLLIDGDSDVNPFAQCFPDDHNVYDPSIGDDAFLVRLRRTDNNFGLDSVGNVSSSESPVPFLFGRGPFGDADFLSRRERGTIVRATAIAKAVAARTVGWYSSDVGYGLAPIWVRDTVWQAGGTIPLSDSDPSADAQFIIPNVQVVSLGEQLTSGPAIDIDTDPERVVAIFADIENAGRRVVGFGIGLVNSNSAIREVTPQSSAIGHMNVSASMINPNQELTESQWNEVFEEHAKFEPDSLQFDQDLEPLLAPARVRAIQ